MDVSVVECLGYCFSDEFLEHRNLEISVYLTAPHEPENVDDLILNHLETFTVRSGCISSCNNLYVVIGRTIIL